MNNFQYHIIGRVDDCTHFFLENIEHHDHFPFALKAKLCWDKNVHEERDAPWQVVLGLMETTFCVFISLALWLEIMIGSHVYGANTPYVYALNDDVSIPNGGKKLSSFVQDYFSKHVFNKAFYQGKLGTHSHRNFSASECRKRGCTKDEKDIQGRWKGKSRVSDVYDNIELPFLDAKVAGCLCMGGPAKYLVKRNSGVTENFVLQYVTPHIRRRLGDRVTNLLGTALLYYVFSPEGSEDVPSTIQDRM